MQFVAEESPDFARRDASETLGAERLRKVQQKTHRALSKCDRLKMTALGVVPFLETERSCKPHLKQGVNAPNMFPSMANGNDRLRHWQQMP
ncbi:MAG: hypothetical protein KR126chlam3_00542 [Chlamydiae bacterium]|nr:hypothetical protein [Chlamydiota bacterium]